MVGGDGGSVHVVVVIGATHQSREHRQNINKIDTFTLSYPTKSQAALCKPLPAKVLQR